jgi:outer membrane lipoprotein-sorting protein
MNSVRAAKDNHRNLCLVFTLAVFFVVHSAPAANDIASQYLRAWAYRDYSTMYQLSSEETRKMASQQEFAAAAASLPVIQPDARIVSNSPSGSGTAIYFESASDSGSPVRGSLILANNTIQHPEIIAKLSTHEHADVLTSNDTGSTASQRTIDGETVDSILQKMNDASAKAESMTMDVTMQGSILGQTVNETGKLEYKKPDKFHMQLSSFVMNSNGEQSTLYMPAANMYMDLAQFGNFELSPGVGVSADEMKRKYQVRLTGKRDLQGAPAFELQLKPNQQDMGGLFGSGDMHLLVSAKTWLPVQAEMSGIKLLYSNIRINDPSVTDAAFQYSPPAGATSLSLGSLMGAIQQVPAQ